MLEEFFKEKAKENQGTRTDILQKSAKSLEAVDTRKRTLQARHVIASGMTNQKLGNSTGFLKSGKALDQIDTKKELAKLAGVNINLITRKYLTGRRYKEEKKAVGENQFTDNSLKRGGSNFLPSMRTAERIGAQVGMSNLTIASDMTNQRLGNSTGFLKSGKALDQIDTKKELAKLAL